MSSGRTNNFPWNWAWPRSRDPTIFGIRSNISLKLLELETSTLVGGSVLGMPSRRTINFLESGRGLGHVTSTIFSSTVGYPSDSLASCSVLLLHVVVSSVSSPPHDHLSSSHYKRTFDLGIGWKYIPVVYETVCVWENSFVQQNCNLFASEKFHVVNEMSKYLCLRGKEHETVSGVRTVISITTLAL